MTRNEVIILGSGTSTGIPMLGCKCSVCTSSNPYDTRLRTSIFLKLASGINILVDTSPDLRTQLLRANIEKIDAVIITHDHADHLHGIDDLRPLTYFKGSQLSTYIPFYLEESLKTRFPYIFNRNKRPIIGGGIPLLNLLPLKGLPRIEKIESEDFYFFLLPHAYTETMCFRHKNFAYITDCQSIPDHVVEALSGPQLDLLIIEYIQPTEQGTHLYEEKCFHYLDRIRPKRAGLIHMNHFISHQELIDKCKARFDFPVFPVYDEQSIDY